jgi:hypothetical protein
VYGRLADELPMGRLGLVARHIPLTSGAPCVNSAHFSGQLSSVGRATVS